MRTLLLLLLIALVGPLAAQSISGNLNAGSSTSALGYGNVDIYRGDELVASVLTDRSGNYHVRLDTGTYRCVVSYDGYVSSTRTVRVTADEKMDLTMKKDLAALSEKERSRESRVMKTYTDAPAPMARITADLPSAPGEAPLKALPPTFGEGASRQAIAHGMLTAGEVNDFAKWTQWQDLATKAFAAMRNLWDMAPVGRHTVDVQTKEGLPIADAVVRLKRKDGTLLFQARTDNTGKAELWSSLDGLETTDGGRNVVEVDHGGRTYQVPRARSGDRLHRLVINTPCAASDVVDVAFVVDATGSMQDELDFLRAEMNDIIYRSKRIGDRLNFRFANLFYRDAGSEEAYTTRSMDFTRVLSEAVSFISAQAADGGGDTPEAVEVALDSAINRLSWSPEARARILFLVLDAGPHLTIEVKVRMKELVRQAAAKGIRIVPIAASGTHKATEFLLRTLALGTNGTYTFLTDHSGVGNPHVEPSTDRYDVATLNDQLVRILKSYTYMPDCQQQVPELELNYPDSLVALNATDSAGTLPLGDPSGPDPSRTSIQWRYYPNPTAGLVNITADTAIPELYITDLSGKVLQVVRELQPAQVVQVDLGAYATGIYLIRYPVGDRWVSGKVVLQRS